MRVTAQTSLWNASRGVIVLIWGRCESFAKRVIRRVWGSCVVQRKTRRVSIVERLGGFASVFERGRRAPVIPARPGVTRTSDTPQGAGGR